MEMPKASGTPSETEAVKVQRQSKSLLPAALAAPGAPVIAVNYKKMRAFSISGTLLPWLWGYSVG
jgi:hypothetical protein